MYRVMHFYIAIALLVAFVAGQPACPDGCFVPVSNFPRVCSCIKNECFDTANPTSDSCYPCNKRAPGFLATHRGV